jgi:hypothetical protein
MYLQEVNKQKKGFCNKPTAMLQKPECSLKEQNQHTNNYGKEGHTLNKSCGNDHV